MWAAHASARPCCNACARHPNNSYGRAVRTPPMGEFELIQRYFTRPTPKAVLGVGDDCALLQPGSGMQMAISTDMLVAGRHFFPDVDPRLLGHKALADAHGCELIGGDTTRGPLNICITVFGEVPSRQALLRSGARAGDDVYVSGTLGDARLALEALRSEEGR